MRRGELPDISLKDSETGDKYYQDVENVLETFEGVSIRDLDTLKIEGQVTLAGAVLRKNVEIINHSGSRIDLNHLMPKTQGRLVLENASVRIGADGRLERKSA
jgi:hypothetical protein